MEIDLHRLLLENPLLLAFVVIGLGYLVGRLRIGGVDVGVTAGVLLVGLLLGHLGFPDQPGAASFGFAIFIFSVGVQAGPSFFGALREDGRRYILLALVVAGTAAILATVLSRVLGLEHGFGAGLLAGALTSTPTLAGAQDAVTSGLARLPEGMDAARASRNVSVGYAITYLFGTVGTITCVRFLPGFLGIDLPAEARRIAQERGIGIRRRVVGSAAALPIVRAYRVGEEAVGKTLEQRCLELERKVLPLRVRRGREILDADPSLEIEEGDIVSSIASVVEHRQARERLGDEILDPELIDFAIVTREIVVSQATATGKPLSELGLREEYGCLPVRLTRATIDLTVEPGAVLQRGDRLQVTGEESRVGELAESLGYLEGEVEQTDLLTFSFGMVAGFLLGLVVVKLGGISIGLGTAGGLLLVGILVGFLGSVNPTFGLMPAPARSFLMNFGLALFMASVGLKAGAGVVEALVAVGPAMIGAGVLVTLVPVGVGFTIGRYALGMNPALLLGSITGAMTSTPSLNVLAELSRSSVPALGYAGTYTFANVLLTFAGTVMMML